MSVDLSIIIPGIRPERWNDVEKSAKKSCKNFSYEMIFIGPKTGDWKPSSNSIFVQDWGSPNRAQQLGASKYATGKFILAAADDGIFRPGELDKILDVIADSTEVTVVSTKYTEGDGKIHGDWYYRLANAYPRTSFIPDNWWIFNSALMHRSYFNWLGGWDASIFSVPCLAHADLAARAQRDGCKVIFYDTPIIDCSHMPGTSGDHAPIHYSHIKEEQIYKQIYSDPECLTRVRIPLDNWKEAEEIWRPRFGND